MATVKQETHKRLVDSARFEFEQLANISVRSRILVRLRWVAVLGQLVTILAVAFGLNYEMPVVAALNTVFALAVFNFIVSQTMPPILSNGQATVQLGFDLVQLGLLLYLTGGLMNPFAVFMVAPVVISSSSLSRSSTVILSALAMIILAVLYQNHLPLPWKDGVSLLIPDMYILSFLLSMVVSISFITLYSYKVALDGRRQNQAVGTLQESLSRARKMAALGAISAAAAHEMGTPLNSIQLIANDLQDEVGKKKKAQADLKDLLSQVRRCKKILTELATNPDKLKNAHFDYVRLDQLVEEMFLECKKNHKGIKTSIELDDGVEVGSLKVFRSVELEKSIRNLVNNALRFAETKVSVRIGVVGPRLQLTIEDDGPGFNADILPKLGEPYLGGRSESNLGLGVFIAQTLLTSLGAHLTFRNSLAPQKGAVVDIRLPRRIQRSTHTDA